MSKTITVYDLQTASTEVRNAKDVRENAWTSANNADVTTIKSFESKDEALAELAKYKNSVKHREGTVSFWEITQYWVEESVYELDEDGDRQWAYSGGNWDAEWENDRLWDLTGNQSGVIVWPNGDAIICNWANLKGIPHLFGGELVSDDEPVLIVKEENRTSFDISGCNVLYSEPDADEAFLEGEEIDGDLYITNNGVKIFAPSDWN